LLDTVRLTDTGSGKVLLADAVDSNARLVPHVKESLAVPTSPVPAAVVTVRPTLNGSCGGGGGEHQ